VAWPTNVGITFRRSIFSRGVGRLGGSPILLRAIRYSGKRGYIGIVIATNISSIATGSQLESYQGKAVTRHEETDTIDKFGILYIYLLLHVRLSGLFCGVEVRSYHIWLLSGDMWASTSAWAMQHGTLCAIVLHSIVPVIPYIMSL